MGRGKPVELTTRTFDTQAVAGSYFKDMLNRYRPGERISDDDALDLGALLERHTEYSTKVGCGVSHFEVMMTDHGTQCFRVVRTDGTGTDFSYVHCVKQRPPTRKQEVCHAFRQAVRYDLYNARDNFFDEYADTEGRIECAVTGERITRDQGHLDHRPPLTFEVLVMTFLNAKGLTYDEVPLSTGRDEQVSPEIVDQALSESFRAFHKAMAKLDYVKDKINLGQSSRHRVKNTRITLIPGQN